jgi:two-component system response regulator FixJ
MPDEPHVYVVDDDEAVRDSLSVLLEARGHRVRSFDLAQQFLDMAPMLRPGCLIADIRMPGMDGLELQRNLNDRALRFPMIVITGHGDVPLAVRAMKAGAVDFIEKPFATQTIVDSVDAALRRLEPVDERAAAAVAAAAKLELAYSRNPPCPSHGQDGSAQPVGVDPPGSRGGAAAEVIAVMIDRNGGRLIDINSWAAAAA